MIFKTLRVIGKATAVLTLVFGFLFNPAVSAAFDKNTVMSDAVFNASTSMSAAQIDSWLNSNYGSTSCISTLHKFKAPEPIAFDPGSGFSSSGSFNYSTAGFWYGADVSAGTVIYDAAHVYGLNPEVILATLEKEESLVSGSNGCSTLRYSAALGYDCPDEQTLHNYSRYELYSINGVKTTSVSNTCVARQQETGFSQQVIYATWQLRFNEQRSEGNTSWNVQVTNFPHSTDKWDNSGDPNFCYSGYMTPGNRAQSASATACGGTQDNQPVPYDGKYTIDSTSVTMDTGATASLYTYTPHISGNQSFYNLFVGWFGSTQADPIRVSVINGYSNESGGAAVVEYYLISAPSANVTIPFALNDPAGGPTDEASFSQSSNVNSSTLTITPSTWNDPASNKVTLYGRDDNVPDGDVSYILIAGAPSSSDPAYGNLSSSDTPNVDLINQSEDPDITLTGNWSGTKEAGIGLKRGNEYFENISQKTLADFHYGTWTDTSLVGAWQGGQESEIGLKRGNEYFLSNNHKTIANFSYGQATDTALVGSWDGSGKDEIGLKRGNEYFLSNNHKTIATFHYGKSSDTVLVGDWNGDGKDDIAVKRGNYYYLNYGHDSTADVVFRYGNSTDIPIVGDWDGSGKDEIGLKRGNEYFLSNNHKTIANFSYGQATDTALVGSWDGSGKDEIGLKRGNEYFLSNNHKTIANFSYGR